MSRWYYRVKEMDCSWTEWRPCSREYAIRVDGRWDVQVMEVTE